MKRLTTAICTIGLCLAPTSVLFADQHEEENGNMGRVYIVTAKDGHGDQFEKGVKAYFKCYGENGGTKAWNVWWAETGKLGRYAFTTEGHKWSAFDGMEEASEECNDVFQQQFLAHMDKSSSEFTKYLPDVSYEKEGGEANVVEVINFEIKDRERFMSAIGKVSEAAKASEWHDGHYWYSVLAGGKHAADFFVALPESSFAGFGEDEGFWDMVEKHHGEEAMGKIDEDFKATVDSSWSDIWRKRPEMSYSPEGSE